MPDPSVSNLQAISELVNLLNDTEGLRRPVRGWHRRVLFLVDDEPLLLILGGDRVEIRAERPAEADIVFTMDSQTLRQIVDEKITPLKAKTDGKIQSTGKLMDILKFVSVLSNTIRTYHRQPG